MAQLPGISVGPVGVIGASQVPIVAKENNWQGQGQ